MSEKSVRNSNISGNPAQNLQAGPGGPNVATIAQTNEQAQRAQTANNYAVVEGGNQGTNEFPYVPFAQDSYDSIANIKFTAAGGLPAGAIGGPAPANYTVPFEKEDAEYLLRQRAQVENADYDRWVMQKYDLTDPAQNFLMQQIAPDQFQRRLDLIDYQQALVSKYARIRLLGAKSTDDLRFEWLVETGRIQLPAGPLWDPKVWMDNQYAADRVAHATAEEKSAANRARFMKGLFNPLKYLDQGSTGHQPNYDNRADIRGIDDAPTIGQLFAGSAAASPYTRYGSNPIQDRFTAVQTDAVPGVKFGEGYGAAVPAVAAGGAYRGGLAPAGGIPAARARYFGGPNKGYGNTGAII